MVEQTVDTTTPLVFSLLAGLSTCLGAAVVFVKRDMTHKHMTFSLSLAGSVMTTVSFVSILPETFSTTQALPERIASFLLGCLLYFVVSKFALPEPDSILGLNNDDDVGDQAYTRVSREEQGALLYEEHDPEEATSPSTHRFRRHRSGNSVPSFEEENKPFHDGVNGITNYNKFEKETWSWKAFSAGRDLATDDARRAWRVSLLLFVSLAVHNFPEGLAVAASTMHSKQLGITTTVAIALHNIPEGIAIAVPCLAARPDSPWLAFGLASLSGFAEPIGAAVALYFIEDQSLSMSNILSFVAGVMVAVAFLELFPESYRYSRGNSDNKDDDHRWALVAGTITGLVVMVGSELYLDR